MGKDLESWLVKIGPVEIGAKHFNDDNGNPAGGWTKGVGIDIQWQNGPLGRDEDRIEPNGAFVESVIGAALNRLTYYETSKFACDANKEAISHLLKALEVLEKRTSDRESRGVEGTHEV